MAERKERMALLSRYARLYNLKYGSRPNLNMNKEQWAADGLVESYGLPSCYDLLAYYFEVSSNPDWNYFAYNAETIIESRSRLEEDNRERAERRLRAKEWLSG